MAGKQARPAGLSIGMWPGARHGLT